MPFYRTDIALRTTALLVPIAVAASVLPACGAVPAEGSPPEQGVPEETGTVTSALSTDLCTLVRTLSSSLTSLGGGAVDVKQATCDDYKVDNAYFHGAGQLDQTLNDLYIYPFVTTGAYYCALQDADGAFVTGTIGASGLSSKYTLYKRDPSTLTLSARRTSFLSLFGAQAALGVEDITIGFPTEKSADNNWWGGNMTVTSAGKQWDINAAVTFPVGPVMVMIHPQIHMRSPMTSDTNDSLRLQSYLNGSPMSDASNVLSAAYKYDAWNTCRLDPTCPHLRSAASDAELIADHAQTCPASVWSTTDHILPFKNPFAGALCGATNTIYLNTAHNWFEFGRPVGSLVSGEPSHDLQSSSDLNNGTFYGSVEASATFDADIASITVDANLSMAARDGFALRQAETHNADSTLTSEVFTQLSAQSRADLHVTLTIELLSWLPNITISFNVPLGNSGDKEAFGGTHKLSDIQYRELAHTSFLNYSVKDVLKTNADSARGPCLSAPTVSNTPPAPGDPGAFLKSAATQFVHSYHPCHVDTCSPSGLDGKNFEWNSSTQRLEVTHSGSCSTCQQQANGCYTCNQVIMDLCDDSDVAIPGTHVQLKPFTRAGCTR